MVHSSVTNWAPFRISRVAQNTASAKSVATHFETDSVQNISLKFILIILSGRDWLTLKISNPKKFSKPKIFSNHKTF